MSKYSEMIATAPMNSRATGLINTSSEAQTYGRLCASQGWAVSNIHETVEQTFIAIALSAYQARLNRMTRKNNRPF